MKETARKLHAKGKMLQGTIRENYSIIYTVVSV